ncbi:MAG: gamma-aminobutyrate permease [Gammaproteobacteria bacterium RIFCSPHIGHO2_12_FULL_35_23]|nr:MAG: gamma-aminobutyrate permease [Gammaproteobacteria bacterium RIFCSPHIGHO2_12_FULL_35_23]
MNLHRKLSARQISMIAIGGAIGTGLFLASGNAIALAGPGGTLLAYLIMGIMVYFLMTSLGEMSSYLPTSGSFYTYAARFVDPALGYALGCNYWYNWAITVAAEIAAASLVMKYWFPYSHSLLWSSLFLGFFIILNIISVRGFGESEYWLSLTKVIVIIVFIIAGTAVIFGLLGHNPVGFKNWTIGDAPFHNGFLGVLQVFMIVGFSFQGTELIGVAAGESKDPAKNIPKAMKRVFWRILLFYILAMLVISFLIPYTSPLLMSTDLEVSPFTMVFRQTGIIFAASLMNAVVLIAILSAGNSGMYASTRMLWYLAKQGHVPAIFAKVSRRGIPVYALLATALIGMMAFLSSLYGNGTVYIWLVNASSLSGFIAWLGIAISHYRFRKAYIRQGRDLKQLPYVAKGYPYAPLIAFFLCLVVIAGQNYVAFKGGRIDWHGIMVSYIGIPLFLALWLGYKFIHKTKVVKLEDCDFITESIIEKSNSRD